MKSSIYKFFPRNFIKFTGKHLRIVSFLFKLQPLGLLNNSIIKQYQSCCIILIRIGTILSKNMEHVLSQFLKVINMNFAFRKLFNNLFVAAWDHTFYSRRHYMKISSAFCFNSYIYIQIDTYIYIQIHIYILFFT